MVETITLYRVGPLPSESKEIAARSNMSDWVREAWEIGGGAEAAGRWFTSDKTAAAWYKEEHPEYPIRSIVVDKAVADTWAARNHVTARFYASEPKHEYFVPAYVADRAREGLVERVIIQDRPREQVQRRSYGIGR